MMMNLLKNSDWAFLLDFVSPTFFKVIPPLELAGNAAALAKRTRDSALLSSTAEQMQTHFGRVLPDVRISANSATLHSAQKQSSGSELKTADEAIRRQVATRIVEIYFAQILSGNNVLLDVRLSRFAQNGESLVWNPAPLIGVFSADFLSAMGDLYKAYYGGHPERMKTALRRINLDWAYQVFISHFGEGNQTDVRFKVSHFVHTFHQIFVLCKAERKNLKGEFVQLGVLLGLMYESLESLDVSVDVRGAFERVLTAQGIVQDSYP